MPKENSLVETANMIEPKLHDGASAAVSICSYKKLNKVFFFTIKIKQIRNRYYNLSLQSGSHLLIEN
jgi:hypothetical protein